MRRIKVKFVHVRILNTIATFLIWFTAVNLFFIPFRYLFFSHLGIWPPFTPIFVIIRALMAVYLQYKYPINFLKRYEE